MEQEERIAILDFGSQYTQLIARRIREMGVFTEIYPCETRWSALRAAHPKGVILSGGPQSLEEGQLPLDTEILGSGVPVLGICYGMQLMNHLAGGTVKSLGRGEYGKQQVSVDSRSQLFQQMRDEQVVWMSHRDSIDELASNFQCISRSDDGLVAAIAHQQHPLFGVQFHPEVTHTEQGTQLLRNFIELCRCKGDWNMQHYLDLEKAAIQERVGNGVVFSLVSGGVDSTVSTALCVQALGAERVHALYVDTGLMRLNETEEVKAILGAQGLTHLHIADRSQRFLDALAGIEHPEEKRRRIGTLFIEVLEEEMRKLGLDHENTFFCQGTLYTDLIESGKGCGGQAAVIKTHHNVNPPLVEEKRRQGLIVEPNREIFKDEVRALGELLGMPEHMVWRHPFPGPGLAIRILGEVTRERLDRLRQADAIYLEEIRRAGLYRDIWQAFAVLLPVTTVGVMGDQRTEGQVIALRAVTSSDGMTADTFRFPEGVLEQCATRIVNEVNGVNRVTYDITSKPPGTIEWE